ncbi:hypothetical protein RJ55_02057 [Drechmeria coniospora]|nr:hypothetical protein RJ55_02057 [Drechmeria coniospora]
MPETREDDPGPDALVTLYLQGVALGHRALAVGGDNRRMTNDVARGHSPAAVSVEPASSATGVEMSRKGFLNANDGLGPFDSFLPAKPRC